MSEFKASVLISALDIYSQVISSSLTASSTYISKHCYLYPSPLSNYISNCYLLSPLGCVVGILNLTHPNLNFWSFLPKPVSTTVFLFSIIDSSIYSGQKFLSHFWFPSFPHTGIQSKPLAYSISSVFHTGSESKHFFSHVTITSYHDLSSWFLQ